jgi:hypothetical protein
MSILATISRFGKRRLDDKIARSRAGGCLCLGALVLAGGCSSNGFHTRYSGLSRVQVCAMPDYIPTPDIIVGNLPDKPFDEIVNEMYAEGYVLIGTAQWMGRGNLGNADAKEQAKNIGAACVLWRANFSHSESLALPVPVFTPGQVSTTYMSGRAYAGLSSGSYYGSATTYTPGSVTTNYVPVSVRQYNYTGAFFARCWPGILGIKTSGPDNAYKRMFDTNSGWRVVAVARNGRAFVENIFPGDVIMSINGQPCFPGQEFPSWRFNAWNELQIYRPERGVLIKRVFVETQ